MPDQADRLRQLIAHKPPSADVWWDGPPMIVVAGGKGGLGTTIVAINLTVALTHNGHRAVLMDLAPQADVAHLAGIDAADGSTAIDIAEGNCSAIGALRPGPAGTLLITGRWASAQSHDWSSHSLDRLLE